MRRIAVAMLCCALVTVPVAAQDVGREAEPAPQPPPRFNLSRVTFDAARTTARDQGPQATGVPAPSRGSSSTAKTVYAISLGAAAGGTIYNISKVREALDHRLEARTFPLVWLKTSDPADKGKMSSLVGGVNGALMAMSVFAYRAHNTRTAILINLLVAGATTGVALHDRSVINKSK